MAFGGKPPQKATRTSCSAALLSANCIAAPAVCPTQIAEPAAVITDMTTMWNLQRVCAGCNALKLVKKLSRLPKPAIFCDFPLDKSDWGGVC